MRKKLVENSIKKAKIRKSASGFYLFKYKKQIQTTFQLFLFFFFRFF